MKRVKDIIGNKGTVTDEWRQGGEWFVRVQFDTGGSRVAPEGCFTPIKDETTDYIDEGSVFVRKAQR